MPVLRSEGCNRPLQFIQERQHGRLDVVSLVVIERFQTSRATVKPGPEFPCDREVVLTEGSTRMLEGSQNGLQVIDQGHRRSWDVGHDLLPMSSLSL